MSFITKSYRKYFGSMVSIIAMSIKLEFFINNIIVSSMIEVLSPILEYQVVEKWISNIIEV